jgi:hypothetical protein
MARIEWKSRADADAEAAALEERRLEVERADAELAQAIDEATTLQELKDALNGRARPRTGDRQAHRGLLKITADPFAR